MELTVHLFGMQARLTGRRQLRVPLAEGACCADLLSKLAEQEPALVPSIPVSRVAVNQRYAAEDDLLHPQDEVALIGLISGG